MSFRSKFSNWFRYNLITFPLIAAVYVPYQLFWIGLTPFQLVKWLTTSGALSAAFNLIQQPILSLAYRRKWLK